MSVELPQHITFDKIATLPNRLAYLDQTAVRECQEKLKSGTTILFHPIQIWETYLPEKDGVISFEQYAFRMYKLVMFGILRSGEKVTVVIDDVLPFMEIRIPKDSNVSGFVSQIKSLAAQQNIKVKEWNIIRDEFSFKEFNDRASYLQLSFTSTYARQNAINYFGDKKQYELTHDDKTCYYRVLCRDTCTSWNSWLELDDYVVTRRHKFFNTRYVINISYTKLRNFTGDIYKNRMLSYDQSIEANFDIETFDPDPNAADDVPQPESKTAEMFSISVPFVFIDADVFPISDCDPRNTKYSWEKPPGHLAHFIITMAITPPMKNRTVIQCRNMREMVQAFAVLFRLMQPDLVPTFNGDNYDWRWIAEIARQHNLLEFMERNMSVAKLEVWRQIEEKQFANPTKPFPRNTETVEGRKRSNGYYWWKSYTFKISSELQNYPGAYLGYPGYVTIDLMPQLRAACGNPGSWSLGFFLKMFNLGGKVDMPYKTMFEIYRQNKDLQSRLELTDFSWDAVVERVREKQIPGEEFEKLMTDTSAVNEYCNVDSLKCHDLLVKTCFIRDRREIGTFSYVPFEDCVFRANGMKVRNLTITAGQQRKIHFTNRPPAKIETGKYPGAHVIPPRKGVATAKISPRESRESTDAQYAEWRAMPDEMYNRILQKIHSRGVWFSDYTDDDFKTQDWPECFVNWLKLETHYPVCGLDFASLYPSLIMTYNLSPEKMVHTLDRALELSEQGHDIHPINFKFNGRDIKGWSVRHEFQGDPSDEKSNFGLFPTILLELFNKRKAMKKDLAEINSRKEHIESLPIDEFKLRADEYREVMFKFNALNSKQKALKVFMNTFYGECGNCLSPLRVLALAGGVTSSGQYNLKMVADYVDKIKCRLYYGDSVTGDTPILLRDPATNLVTFRTVQEAVDWQQADNSPKEVSDSWNNMEVWSADGWTKIHRVIRHKTDKRIYRVSTGSGLVDVTEDHSLLNENGTEIRPSECTVGTRLMHKYPTDDQSCDYEAPLPSGQQECRAFVYGFFFGNKLCEARPWWVVNCDKEVICRILRNLEVAYPDRQFKFISGKIVLTSGDAHQHVEEYKLRFYHNNNKRVPDEILNAPTINQSHFVSGYLWANPTCTEQSTMSSAGMYYLFRRLGYHSRISVCDDSTYQLTLGVLGTKIKSLTVLHERTEQYVYDLTTENHTFQAGIGSMIVHNTDSCYISMPRHKFMELDKAYYSQIGEWQYVNCATSTEPKWEWVQYDVNESRPIRAGSRGPLSKAAYFEQLVLESFREIRRVNKDVNDMLRVDNGTDFLKMSYEEFLFPVAFFSKKKYAGIPHENIYNHNPKEIFVRGLDYIKKGASQMLIDMSIDILNKVFRTDNIESLMKIVEDKIEEIYTLRNIEFDKFIKTDAYRPNKDNVKVQTFYKRMLEIGMPPLPLERFSYVIVKKYPFKYDVRGRKTPLTVGDRMEYAERAKSLGMEIDLDYYMASNVCGQLARFICYHPMFHVEPKGDTLEDYEDAETKNINACKKYIEQLFSKWSDKYVSQGPALKNLYKKVNAVFHTEFTNLMNMNVGVPLLDFDSVMKPVKGAGTAKRGSQLTYEENNIMFHAIQTKIEMQSDREAAKEAKEIIERINAKTIDDWIEQSKIYKSLLEDRQQLFNKHVPAILYAIRAKIQQLRSLFVKRDTILGDGIKALKPRVFGSSDEQFENLEPILSKIQSLDDDVVRGTIIESIRSNITKEDILTLAEIDNLYVKLINHHKFVKSTKKISSEIDSFIRYKLGDTMSLTNAVCHTNDLDTWMDENL